MGLGYLIKSQGAEVNFQVSRWVMEGDQLMIS
jgi:hypothetical protein